MAGLQDILSALGIQSQQGQLDPMAGYMRQQYGVQPPPDSAPAPVMAQGGPSLGVSPLSNPLDGMAPPSASAPPPAEAPQYDPSAYGQRLPGPPAGGRGPAEPAYVTDARQTAQMQANAVARQQAAEDARSAEIASKTALQETAFANQQRQIEEHRAQLYADIDKRQKDILSDAANQPAIDPARVYKNTGTAGKIASVAAGFISGLINPAGGAQNVTEVINRVVEQDIQGQVANMEQRNRLLGLRQGALDKDFARGSDLLDFQLKASARAYDGAIRLVTAEAAKKWGGEIGQAKAQSVIAGIADGFQNKVQAWRDEQTRLGLQRQQVGIAGGQLALARDNAKFEHGMQAGQFTRQLNQDISKAPLDAAEAKLRTAQAQKALAGLNAPVGLGPEIPAGLKPDEARKLEVHGSGGQMLGWANDDTTAREARKQLAGYDDIRKDLSDYRALADKYGREFSVGGWSTDALKTMEAKHKRLMTTVKEVEKLGVLSGDDLKLLKGQIPGPQGWLGGSPLPAIDEALSHADQAIDRYVRINIPGVKRYSPLSAEEIAAMGGRQGATIDPSAPSGRVAPQGLPPPQAPMIPGMSDADLLRALRQQGRM